MPPRELYQSSNCSLASNFDATESYFLFYGAAMGGYVLFIHKGNDDDAHNVAGQDVFVCR